MGEIVDFAGIFFDDSDDDSEVVASLGILKSIEGDRALESTRTTTHCTFAYHPSDEKVEELNDIVGDIVEVEVVGYGNDKMNSGFLIRIITPGYDEYYRYKDREGRDIPKHITMSIARSKNASAVNTKNLNFDSINPRVRVKGRFGYWIRNKKKRKDNGHLSYDRFAKSIKM